MSKNGELRTELPSEGLTSLSKHPSVMRHVRDHKQFEESDEEDEEDEEAGDDLNNVKAYKKFEESDDEEEGEAKKLNTQIN